MLPSSEGISRTGHPKGAKSPRNSSGSVQNSRVSCSRGNVLTRIRTFACASPATHARRGPLFNNLVLIMGSRPRSRTSHLYSQVIGIVCASNTRFKICRGIEGESPEVVRILEARLRVRVLFALKFAQIAQLAAHESSTLNVAGSIPALRTIVDACSRAPRRAERANIIAILQR